MKRLQVELGAFFVLKTCNNFDIGTTPLIRPLALCYGCSRARRRVVGNRYFRGLL